MAFHPHTDAEIRQMLDFCGLASLDDLWSAVPEALRLSRSLAIADGLSEHDAMARMEDLAGANRPAGRDLVCFAGGGAYDHDVPAVVRRVAFRAEYVTAYTPYQPEVAQGVLQALFEYQTIVSRLAGVPVANASLYDGATACVEAVNLAVAAAGRPRVWISQGVHPTWRETIRTYARGTGHQITEVGLDEHGRTAWPESDPDDGSGAPAALLVGYPNHLGVVEDLAAARRIADEHGALLLVALDPVSMGLLTPPGAFGADVVVGEGQPFGTPMSFGGPYLGLFACKQEHVRRLPGRLVGETVDTEGRTAYVTTLRTREQDIRREKASSNVCTNQTLIAVCAVIHLGWLGTAGLREMALRCARGARYAREALLAIPGVEALVDGPVVREFAVRLPSTGPTAAALVDDLAEQGFLAGIPLATEYGAGEHGLLVAVTEKRTKNEIDAFASALEKAVSR